MNKNLFKTFAIAAMAVLAGACAKEQVGPSDGETTEVSFNVEVPGASVATKGISDAASVDELVFQALLQHKYTDPETKKTVKEYIPVPELTKVVPVVDKKASITASLVKGQWYQFIFWAQKKGTGYYNVNTDELNNIDLRTITLDYKRVKTNDELLDAFYAVQGPTKGRELSSDVKLKRALAQINFGSEQSNRQDAGVSKASITLKNVPTTFYPLLAGTRSACGNISEQDIVLSDNDVMSEPLSVNSVNYDYLATTYVFAPKNDPILVDASATFNFESGTTTTVKAPNAPVKQNFRTNIIGNLLFANAEWNVTIDPNFQSGDIAYDAVSSCLQAGQTVTLTEDYSVAAESAGVDVVAGAESVLNLNGHKFVNENGYAGLKAALQVKGSLTINGEGSVICEGGGSKANNAIYVETGGHLIINGGYYYVGKATTEKSNSTIFVQSNGDPSLVEINGGVFEAEVGSDGTPFVLNQADDLTVNCFSVKGGVFVGFNPAKVNENKGAITSFVAEGYRSVKIEYEGKEAWKVEEIPAVTTQEAFTSAVAEANATVKLAEGTYTLPSTIGSGVTILGPESGSAVIIDMEDKTVPGYNAVSFKNMSFKVGNADYKGFQQSEKLVFDGCTFEGQVVAYGTPETYKNCTFIQSGDQYCLRIYGSSKTIIQNCKFRNTLGKAILIYNEGTVKQFDVTVDGCTMTADQEISGKTAIQMHTELGIFGTLTIRNTTVTGFDSSINGGLWNDINNTTKKPTKKFTVTVDGKTVQTAE